MDMSRLTVLLLSCLAISTADTAPSQAPNVNVVRETERFMVTSKIHGDIAMPDTFIVDTDRASQRESAAPSVVGLSEPQPFSANRVRCCKSAGIHQGLWSLVPVYATVQHARQRALLCAFS
ncbi:hypothetical protein MRX96_023905 [Rhipicephalus microplus]